MAATLAQLEEAYRSGYRRFLRVATAVTGDEQVAADAVHDAFVRAVRHRRRFRGESSLDAWVWTIVVNEARRGTRRSGLAPPLPEPASGDEAPAAELRRLVAALPERQRLVLFLRYYADLDYASIAGALGVAPGTVAATLSTARAKLRRALEEVETCET